MENGAVVRRGRRWGLVGRFGVCLLGMLLVVGLTVVEGTDNSSPVGAAEFESISGQHWTTVSEARVGEGQENFPFEAYYGQPMSMIELNSTPLSCEIWAAQYYAGVIAEEGALATTGLYYNRTLARAKLPEDEGTGIGGAPARKQKAEVGPGTMQGGPYALSECKDKTHGTGYARFNGMASPQLTIAGAVATTTQSADTDNKVITAEMHSTAFGVEVPGGLSIKVMDSYLKVEQKPTAEPTFSYKLTLMGVSAGGQEIIGFGDKGFKIAGQGPGPEAVKQFNDGAAANRESLKQLFIYDFKIVAPRAYKDDTFDRWNINGPVLEGGIGFPSRRGTLGDYQALRLGSNWYRGTYETVKPGEVEQAPIGVCETC